MVRKNEASESFAFLTRETYVFQLFERYAVFDMIYVSTLAFATVKDVVFKLA